MSGLSKVIVIDPDARASRQVQLGFEREGVPTAVAPVPLDASKLELFPNGDGRETSLVVVGGTVENRALELIRRARIVLNAANLDAPIVFAGRGVRRTDAEAAGADEVVLQPVHLRDVVTIGRLLRGQPAHQRAHIVGSLAETTGVFTLVRALSALGRSAVLTLIRGLRRGEVRFYHGEVTSAQVGLIHGQAALHQLLLWTDARFDFQHEDVVRRQQIPLAHDELFADAERFLTIVRDSSGSLSPSMVLEQDVARIQSFGKQIPTEVHGVLRMFDGHRVLADVLEDSPYRVFETLRVAQRAMEVGLLRQNSAPRRRATWRAVLAIEEWLVGPREDAPSSVESEPIKSLDSASQRKKDSRRKRRKRRANTPLATPPIQTKPEIDWGALVPRILGAEVGPLAGVVPASHASGEILLPTSEEPREKLEALMDTDKRERIFPRDIGLEPTVVWNENDDAEREKREAAAREEAAAAARREAESKAAVDGASRDSADDLARRLAAARGKSPPIDKARVEADALAAAEMKARAEAKADGDAEPASVVETAARPGTASARANTEGKVTAEVQADGERAGDVKPVGAEDAARVRVDAEARVAEARDAAAAADADARAAEASAATAARERADAEAKAASDARAEADERAATAARERVDAEAAAAAATAARERADAEAAAVAVTVARERADAEAAAAVIAARERADAEAAAAARERADAEAEAAAATAARERADAEAKAAALEAEARVAAEATAARERADAEAKAASAANGAVGSIGDAEGSTRPNADVDAETRADTATKPSDDAKSASEATAQTAKETAEAEAKARADADAKVAAEVEAKLRAQSEAATAAADERARIETAAKADAERRAKLAAAAKAAADKAEAELRAEQARAKSAAVAGVSRGDSKRTRAAKRDAKRRDAAEAKAIAKARAEAEARVAAEAAAEELSDNELTAPRVRVDASMSTRELVKTLVADDSRTASSSHNRPAVVQPAIEMPSVVVAESASATVLVNDRVSVTATDHTARLIATPVATITESASGAPVETIDEPSDGVVREKLQTADTAPRRPPPPVVIPIDDRPEDTTGEITTPISRKSQEAAASEPTILVADLAAVHTAVSAVAAAQASAPQTPNASSPSKEHAVVEVHKDAHVAFTEIEEDFFRAGTDDKPHAHPKTDSFDDLDEGYQPVGFWDRLLGRKPQRPKR